MTIEEALEKLQVGTLANFLALCLSDGSFGGSAEAVSQKYSATELIEKAEKLLLKRAAKKQL